MRKVKEVLRLRFELGLGQRQVARSCGMGLGRSMSIWNGRWRPESVGRCRKALAKENWKPSCLATSPARMRSACGATFLKHSAQTLPPSPIDSRHKRATEPSQFTVVLRFIHFFRISKHELVGRRPSPEWDSAISPRVC